MFPQRNSPTHLFRLSLVVALIAVTLLAAIQPAPAQAGPRAATYDQTWLWYTDENAQMPQLVIDANNGHHAVFSTLLVNSNHIYPAYYAYCASGCLTPANWSYVILGDMGMFGGGLSIALTPEGQPRVIWQYYTLAGRKTFYYAECNGSCGQPGNWQIGELWKSYMYSDTQSYFAVDPQGAAHFVYDDSYNEPHNGTFYTSCASGCTDPANWTEIQVDPLGITSIDLKFDAAGHPRLAYIPTDTYNYNDTDLIYVECNADCDLSVSWEGVPVMPVDGTTRDDSAFALELTSSGNPRLAMYIDHQMSYAWCDSGCTDATNSWTVTSLGRPAEYGEYVDLELDSQDQPRLAYMVFLGAGADDGMTFATCTAGCTTASPTWTFELVETDDELDASDPVATPDGCQLTTWADVGLNASFALDSSDIPHFVYGARNVAYCGTQVNTVIKGVRYASSTGSVTPGGEGHKVYLPLLRR